MDQRGYEDLLEHVYYAVVTELYRQLKGNVQRKIALLPTKRFPVVALLHEADHYARSNSLYAFEQAQELYWQAAVMCDPSWRESLRTPFLRSTPMRSETRKTGNQFRSDLFTSDRIRVSDLVGKGSKELSNEKHRHRKICALPK